MKGVIPTMLRQVLKSKIHRAIVTEADLNYQGSLTLGSALMDAADLLPYEFVHITNINNGTHWVTYALRDSNTDTTVCMNGTAARHFHPGDPVIILAYAHLDNNDLASHQPRLIYVDESNHIVRQENGEH